MNGAMLGMNDTNIPQQKLYSPLLLYPDWPRATRLLFVFFCATFGTIMNIFFIASFFVEHTLRGIGNIYLACAGFCDLLISAIVMNISIVVQLSDESNNLLFCRFAQFTTEFGTYSYSLFFMLTAAENYYRVCRTSAEYEIFLNMRIGLVSILIYVVSFILAAVGVLLNLDYDSCQREFYGNVAYSFFVAVSIYGIPTIITIAFLVASFSRIRRRSRQEAQYRRSRHYHRDYSSIVMNIIAYVLYVVAWIPYVVVVNGFPRASDALYYHALWFALLRSAFTGFLYGLLNMYFRRAFEHIFKYCCRRDPLLGPYTSRHRRVLVIQPSTGDGSVRVIQQAVSSSPYRGASTSHSHETAV